MEVNVVLSSEEIVRGLKHYRRIAKQDVLRSSEDNAPTYLLSHAEARREIYAQLTSIAENGSPKDVLASALDTYKQLPFVTGTADNDFVEIKGKEHALENFFLMIGLEPKLRREYRSMRPTLQNWQQLGQLMPTQESQASLQS